MTNVLTQMGLGYTFLFLLWQRTFRTQAIAAGGILLFTWLLFILYPGSGLNIERGASEVGVAPAWSQEHLEGIDPSWHKNANVAHDFDTWFLNLLPHKALFTAENSKQVRKPFAFNGGGYQTLSFIPSLATMLFGLMCGELLRSKRTGSDKLKLLIVAGVGGLVVGWLLNDTGICPLVKRIWTPSWALFSTGWCCLILATLYWIIDIRHYQRWAFPLIVVGMNSIAIYCMEMLLKPWMGKTLTIHLGDHLFLIGGKMYEPMIQATLIGLGFWLICWWMYRQKIFVRI
jgi:predicted acyltransferase